MARIAFRGRLHPGASGEYRRRHEAVDPELLAELKRAGARNYSIFLDGDDVFGYLEVEDAPAFDAYMAASAVNQRWQADMRGLVDIRTHPADGQPASLDEVFRLD